MDLIPKSWWETESQNLSLFIPKLCLLMIALMPSAFKVLFPCWQKQTFTIIGMNWRQPDQVMFLFFVQNRFQPDLKVRFKVVPCDRLLVQLWFNIWEWIYGLVLASGRGNLSCSPGLTQIFFGNTLFCSFFWRRRKEMVFYDILCGLWVPSWVGEIFKNK